MCQRSNDSIKINTDVTTANAATTYLKICPRLSSSGINT